MTHDVYNQIGKKAGSVDLPEVVYGVPSNPDLVHQVITSYQSNERSGTAHTKDRSEVRGGGKKPWRQKGTGRARHGSRRSPIWVGGGITFGPRNAKDYSKKINRKMAARALAVMLSEKLRENQMIFVDAINLDAAKTQHAHTIITNLSTVSGFETIDTRTNPRNVLMLVPELTDDIDRAFANLPNVVVDEVRNVNAYDVARFRYLVIVSPEDANAFLVEKMKRSKGTPVVTK